MAVAEERVSPAGAAISDVYWKAVIAGAVAAAALSFVLLAFGMGIGLAVASTSPTWRDTSLGLWILSGTYLVFTALVSFALGGYIAGHMRARLGGITEGTLFRDGLHGLLVWGLAILIGAVLAIGAAHAVAPAAVPSGGQAGTFESVAGENSIAYELDQLFRSDRLPGRDVDMNYTRAEAGRILLTSSGHNGVSPEDRDYLARMVSSRADVSPQEAVSRVNTIIPRAHDALKRARESAVIVAFMTAAALLLGAAVAWYAAREGGYERDIGGAPEWRWKLERRRPLRT
jgi:hypothetical protein